jgi:acyl carrier protein
LIEDTSMRNDASEEMNGQLNFGADLQQETARSAPDRAPACQSPAASVREYVAPRNEVEAGVAEILAQLLMVERVGIHDNFILLGGESLLAAQAAWRIQNRFGCEVTLRSVLTGTVANVAAEIISAGTEG